MKILKIKTLKKGWCDRDHVLLHAAFQVLVDFIEGEKPGQIVDWNHDTVHRKAWKEITDLYRWWKKERPKRRRPLDNPHLKRPPWKFKKDLKTGFMSSVPFDKEKYLSYYRALIEENRLEGEWNEEDQRNLHRLVGIRGYLWT